MIHPFFALLLLLNAAALPAADAPKKPNIIFILTDDVGYSDVGVFFQNQRREKKRAEPEIFGFPDVEGHRDCRFYFEGSALPIASKVADDAGSHDALSSQSKHTQ